jgi:hypothetical protein
VAASTAAPVPNTPVPLATLVSVGALEMQPGKLAPRLSLALASVSAADPARATAIDAFAGVVATKFGAMLLASKVANLMGSGPVPTYDPPAVPAGPVANGTCSGTNIVIVVL